MIVAVLAVAIELLFGVVFEAELRLQRTQQSVVFFGEQLPVLQVADAHAVARDFRRVTRANTALGRADALRLQTLLLHAIDRLFGQKQQKQV